MTPYPAQRRGLSPIDTKFLEIIEKYGWHVTTVARVEGDPDDAHVWAYSTGLYYSYAHPEIIVFNLKYEVMRAVVNEIGSRVKSGKRFEAGRTYDDLLENYQCAFHEVSSGHYKQYVGYSLWFYESSSFPMLQCFWPDKDRQFPWDPKSPDWFRNSQPLLYQPSGNARTN